MARYLIRALWDPHFGWFPQKLCSYSVQSIAFEILLTVFIFRSSPPDSAYSSPPPPFIYSWRVIKQWLSRLVLATEPSHPIKMCCWQPSSSRTQDWLVELGWDRDPESNWFIFPFSPGTLAGSKLKSPLRPWSQLSPKCVSGNSTSWCPMKMGFHDQISLRNAKVHQREFSLQDTFVTLIFTLHTGSLWER